ncbi:MAG TPA: PIG-L family deacetylase [Thermoanaerobaculia bacterium]|nr:PIG-L family deacetylase [Thermoanaerobaculia bacterium]
MFKEAEAIPYEPALLRGERLLVLAPHPDDEVIGCGGLLALHLREQREVRVVIATDGAEAGGAAVREEESRRGLAKLGDNVQVDFLGFPDRQLADIPQLQDLLLAYRPDLILVPAPIEIHPDHFALARIVCELVQRDETLWADLAVARVAFYEVGQPLRPNAIVDITEVAEAKYAAIAEHQSQLGVRDYVGYARGLNTYRTMTLPPEVKFAEAYYVVELPSLRTTPLSELRQQMGAPKPLEVTRTTIPISVIVRTKDRPRLLREAIASIQATQYPCEIVVVNDGGSRVELEGVKLVEHEQSRGRSVAANEGVRAAANAFIAFLDDDDLYYPEHLGTLANASSSSHAAWYTDAVSAFLRPGESGAYETHSRLRLFAQDFDRELLLVDNYIPLPSLLIPRDSFLDLGGFDPEFDLFEDWDFLIRLSARGDFLRIPRITCEVRHFQGGSSVILAAPEGSPQFREAKLRVWKKHASRIDESLFSAVFERQKRRLGALYSSVAETKGQADSLTQGFKRVEREKAELLAQSTENYNTINGYMLRVRELEGATQALSAIAADYERKTLELERVTRKAEQEGDALRNENDQLRRANHETHDALERARVEIGRLNGLLDMIYHSRTWKIHTLMEKMRGRG